MRNIIEKKIKIYGERYSMRRELDEINGFASYPVITYTINFEKGIIKIDCKDKMKNLWLYKICTALFCDKDVQRLIDGKKAGKCRRRKEAVEFKGKKICQVDGIEVIKFDRELTADEIASFIYTYRLRGENVKALKRRIGLVYIA